MLLKSKQTGAAPPRWSAKAGVSCVSGRTTWFGTRKGSGPRLRWCSVMAGNPLTQPLPQRGEEYEEARWLVPLVADELARQVAGRFVVAQQDLAVHDGGPHAVGLLAQ